jgi:hypothetical protein
MDAWSRDLQHAPRYFERLKATPSFRFVYYEDELIPR